MKKYLAIVLAVILCVGIFSGCNKQLIDLNYEFNYAIISLPNGDVVEGKISSWNDYEGEQIQVKMNDKVYVVHSANIVLIKQ